MDRGHFQLLLELDRHGTVSAAATALFITQSAASQRLREAERRLGFALTTRAGRTLTLTPAARRLVEAARLSERALQAAESDARWLASSSAVALQLVQDVYDLTWWLAPLLVELETREDLARVELVRARAGQGLATVLEQRGDVLIAPSDSVPAGSHAYPLFDDELVAVVPANGPLARRRALTPEDFADAAYVTHSTTPQDGFEHATFFAPRRVWPDHILRIESIAAIVGLVAAGPWLSVLPRWTVPFDCGVAAIELDPAPPAIAWSLVSRDLSGFPELQRTAAHLARHLSSLRRAAARPGA